MKYMFSVKGSDIYLTRGDTLILDVVLYKENAIYQPVTGETVRFAMKRRYSDSDEDVLITKTIDNASMQLILSPNDTKDLEFAKYYVYDVEFTDTNGNVDTFIKGKFYLGEEVL